MARMDSQIAHMKPHVFRLDVAARGEGRQIIGDAEKVVACHAICLEGGPARIGAAGQMVRVAVRVVRRELPDYPLPLFYGDTGYLQNGAVRLRRDSGGVR